MEHATWWSLWICSFMCDYHSPLYIQPLVSGEEQDSGWINLAIIAHKHSHKFEQLFNQ